MSNLIFARPLADGGTITTGSEVASLPAGNLLTPQPSDPWRATDLANAYVELDLGTAVEINLIALLYTNASSAATWRIRAAASQANLTAAPDYDTGSNTFWPQSGLEDWSFTHGFIWLDASTQTRRWWRIDVSDAGNPDGYFQAGRLYLAKPFQPATNIEFGWSVGYADPSPKRRATGGQTYPLLRSRSRVLNFSYSFMSESEMFDNLFDLNRRRGASEDVLVIVDPDATANIHERIVYGLVDDLKPIINSSFNIFEQPYRLEEML